MIVRVGETQPMIVTGGTYSGVLVNVLLSAAVVNVPITSSDFKPQYVSVKATKFDRDKTVTVFNDNLLLLGTYNSFYRGYFEFATGYAKKYAAAGVAAVTLRTVMLDFKTPIKIDAGEKLVIEFTVSEQGTFTAALNSTNSFLDYQLIPCIGYDYGTPSTNCRVIQQNSTSDSIAIGDNCLRCLLVNLDQADLQNEVWTNVSILSDKLSYTKTFNQLLAQRVLAFGQVANYRYGTTLPATNTVSRGLDSLPQCFNLYDGIGKGHELDRVRVDLAMNSQYVNPSQNYVISTTYAANAVKVQKAQAKQQQHHAINMKKLAGK